MPFTSLLAARLPSCCEVCGAWPARAVCDRCRARFAMPQPRCIACALPVPAGVDRCAACRMQPHAIDRCVAAVGYAWPWAGLIARCKFRGEPGWARALAPVMTQAPSAGALIEGADHVLPMPLAPRRLAQRGYNQALELARHLAPGKLRANWLLRTRETPPQASLQRRERLANVAHAFALEPRRAAQVAGARILLVDDVMTSGASLKACASVLRRAGAAAVDALVLARTAEPNEATEATGPAGSADAAARAH